MIIDQSHAIWTTLVLSALAHARHFIAHYHTNQRLKGLIEMNPLQLIPAALNVGTDAVKLFKDLQTSDKASAIADTLDALPALAAISGEPLGDLQALLTPERLAIAWDVEQEVVKILPLLREALATYRATH